MSNRRMLLYSLLVAVVCNVLYLALSLCFFQNKLSVEDNVIWGGIFGVGLGMGYFCLLKGYQNTHSGKSRQPFFANSLWARRIFRTAQCTGIVVWGGLTVCMVTPYWSSFTLLEVLVPWGVVFVLFATSVAVARRDMKK